MGFLMMYKDKLSVNFLIFDFDRKKMILTV